MCLFFSVWNCILKAVAMIDMKENWFENKQQKTCTKNIKCVIKFSHETTIVTIDLIIAIKTNNTYFKPTNTHNRIKIYQHLWCFEVSKGKWKTIEIHENVVTETKNNTMNCCSLYVYIRSMYQSIQQSMMFVRGKQ